MNFLGGGKSLKRADLAHHGHRGKHRHPAKALQGQDQLLHPWRRLLDRAVERFVEPRHAFGSMLHFVLVVHTRLLSRRVVEQPRIEPAPMGLAPGLALGISTAAGAKQEFAEPEPSTELIFLGRLTSANQIVQRLVLGSGHKDRRQFACPGRHQRGRNHLAREAHLVQLRVQRISGRSRLVANAKRLPPAIGVGRYILTSTAQFGAQPEPDGLRESP
jgi:hypothetical protein